MPKLGIPSLMLTAAALSKKHKISVLFRNVSSACTTGKEIILPLMPIPEDRNQEKRINTYLRGYIDHEASHVRWTDFKAIIKSENETLFNITNVLEDIRIEKLLGAIYPGCKENLLDLVVTLKAEGKLGFGNNVDLDILFAYCSYRLRASCLNQDTEDLAGMGKKALCRFCKEEALSKIDGIMDKIKTAQSTKETVAIASEILEVFGNPKSQQKQSDKQSSKDGNSEDKKGNQDPQGNSDQTGNQDKDQTYKNSGNDGSPSQNMPDASDTSGKDKNSDSPGTSGMSGNSEQEAGTEQDGQQTTGTGNSSGNGHGGNLPKGSYNVTELLESQIKDLAGKTGKSGGSSDYLVTPRAVKELGDRQIVDINKAAKFASTIRGETISYLEAMTLVKIANKNTGRSINSRRLHRILTPNPSVFQRVSQTKRLNTDLFLILDRSGSMNSGKIRAAANATLALALAYRNIPGVRMRVIAFPAFQEDNVVLLSEGKTVDPQSFNLGAHGNTPLHVPLQWVIDRILEEERESRKIIIVATDGDPDILYLAIKKIESLESLGAKVFGIGIPGITEDRLKIIFGKDKSLVLHNLNQLAPLLAKLFRDHLLD